MISAPMQIEEIGYGDNAIYQTVKRMVDIIQSSLGNQLVRQTAEDLIANVKPNDVSEEIKAIYTFVRDKVRFTRDPKGLEYVQTPDHMLRTYDEKRSMSGDCDDKTVLGLSLLKNIGNQVAIRVVSYRPDGRFTHVYGLVKIGHEWVPFDTTRPDKYLGWEHPGITRMYEAEVGYASLGVSGLGVIDWENVLQQALGITVGYILVNGIASHYIKGH